MFLKNPGGKLKTLARVIFWILMILFIFLAIAVIGGAMPIGENIGNVGGTTAAVIAGVLILLAGFFVSWLSSIFLYAAGEAVEDIHAVRRELAALRREK